MKTKTYMFQYAFKSGSDIHIVKNTDLISIEDAIKLYDTYYKDFIYRLKAGESPELCIWKNCKDKDSYGETLLYLDYNCEIDSLGLYKVIKERKDTPEQLKAQFIKD